MQIDARNIEPNMGQVIEDDQRQSTGSGYGMGCCVSLAYPVSRPPWALNISPEAYAAKYRLRKGAKKDRSSLDLPPIPLNITNREVFVRREVMFQAHS